MSASEDGRPVVRWEMLNTVRDQDGLLDSRYLTERAKVPGGWLVICQFQVGGSHGMAFLPDQRHEWDGGSLP